MKKLINDVESLLTESLDGFAAGPNGQGVVSTNTYANSADGVLVH